MNHPAGRAAELSADRKLSRLLQAAAARLEAAHSAEPRLDAALLLAEACGQSRAWLLAHGGDPLSERIALRFAGFVDRRAQHEPVAYILGHKEFYGLDLLVDRRVLIPRPETETLVEEALAWLRRVAVTDAAAPAQKAARLPGEGSITVMDVGTGSGAIAIAIAAHTPRGVHLIATDLSPDALAVARANAARHGLTERITFMLSDLQESIDTHPDLIVANLPYVARVEWAELAPDISLHEPHLALDGGADGLDLFLRFFAQAPAHLAPGGALLLEIGWQQAAAVRALAHAAFPQSQVTIFQDLAGQDRVALIEPQRPTLPAPTAGGQAREM